MYKLDEHIACVVAGITGKAILRPQDSVRHKRSARMIPFNSALHLPLQRMPTSSSTHAGYRRSGT